MKDELLKNVGDFHVDCERMPAASDLQENSAEFIDKWLNKVRLICDEQIPATLVIACNCQENPSVCGTGLDRQFFRRPTGKVVDRSPGFGRCLQAPRLKERPEILSRLP